MITIFTVNAAWGGGGSIQYRFQCCTVVHSFITESSVHTVIWSVSVRESNGIAS